MHDETSSCADERQCRGNLRAGPNRALCSAQAHTFAHAQARPQNAGLQPNLPDWSTVQVHEGTPFVNFSDLVFFLVQWEDISLVSSCAALGRKERSMCVVCCPLAAGVSAPPTSDSRLRVHLSARLTRLEENTFQVKLSILL